MLLMSGPPAEVHDFHVSRLTVNLDTKRQRLELTLQTFVDDLERGLIQDYQLDQPQHLRRHLPPAADVNLLEPKQHPATDSLLVDYLRRRLQLRVGNAAGTPWTYVGHERAKDPYAMYVYLAVADVDTTQPIRLVSTFLTSVYADQQNVIIWQRDGEATDYDLLTADQNTCRWSR